VEFLNRVDPEFLNWDMLEFLNRGNQEFLESLELLDRVSESELLNQGSF
jgi:hypothetical protein